MQNTIFMGATVVALLSLKVAASRASGAVFNASEVCAVHNPKPVIARARSSAAQTGRYHRAIPQAKAAGVRSRPISEKVLDRYRGLASELAGLGQRHAVRRAS